MSSDRNKQSLQELSSKEEELVVLRVEVTSLQEKLKGRNEEVRRPEWDGLVCHFMVLMFVSTWLLHSYPNFKRSFLQETV